MAQNERYTLYLLHKTQSDCFIAVDADAPSQHGESCGPPVDPSAGAVQVFGAEWSANPRGKTDPSYRTAYGSGDFYGYVEAPAAATVEIDVPGVREPLKAPVYPQTHYFVTGMPEAVWRALAPGNRQSGTTIELPAVARDAWGTVVGRGQITWGS